MTPKGGSIEWKEIRKLPSSVTAHPIESLGFTVYFETKDPRKFPSHKLPPPLNRFLGYGKSMFVFGITSKTLQARCGVGSSTCNTPHQVDSDTGSDVSDEEEEEDEEEDD